MRRVLQIFQKLFRSPGDHRAKYSMAQQVFRKIFHGSSHQFLFLVKSLFVVVFQGSIHVIIQRTEGANVQNNIQTVIFTAILHEIFNLIFKLTRSGNV